MENQPAPMPSRLVDLKKQIVPSDSKVLTEAWERLLIALAKETEDFKAQGPNVGYFHRRSTTFAFLISTTDRSTSRFRRARQFVGGR